ncbi:MAG: 50S ribosomal protein L19 [Bacillota bacterium]
MDLVKEVEKRNMKENVPYFTPGDTVRVHVKVIEGKRERTQAFEGVVISRRGSKARETFTVRRVSFGIGIERIFPIHSPSIDKIEVIKKGKASRAKLNYLRKRKGKAARIKERR